MLDNEQFSIINKIYSLISNVASIGLNEPTPDLTGNLIGANFHNCNPDVECWELHRELKMKSFYIDGEVLQLPIKSVSKKTLCKIIGLLCSELQTCCTSMDPGVKSCQAVDNDLTVKDQESRAHHKSMNSGEIKGSKFHPIRNMKSCSFCC